MSVASSSSKCSSAPNTTWPNSANSWPASNFKPAAPDTAPAAYLQLKQSIGIRPANFLTQVRELDLLDGAIVRVAVEFGSAAYCD